MEIPVYLVAGFLDSGKTSFINGILEDGFAEEATLLLCCEEGDEGYNPKALKNVTVVPVEELAQLTTAYLKQLEKTHKPRQIVIEYNGMWPLETLYQDLLPGNWVLYQIMCFIEAGSFEGYAKNMGQMMMEKLINADLIVFNRCDEALKTALRKRNLRMVNRRADIFLDDLEGNTEPYLTGEECFFDLSAPVLDIPDEDFGLWYVDALDHPARYEGKTVHCKAVMCRSKKFPGLLCPGRFAMVCCEKDVTFLGVICKGEGLESFQDYDWMDLTAQVRMESHEAYQGDGPVLYVSEVKPCGKAEPEVVNF